MEDLILHILIGLPLDLIRRRLFGGIVGETERLILIERAIEVRDYTVWVDMQCVGILDEAIAGDVAKLL